MPSNPLVSCLCLTRDRREWLPKAIECFERQTYPECELVIVASGEQSVTDLVPKNNRVQLLVTGWSLTIGAKRNVGCEIARGEIVVHWDDDDYSSPGRVAEQVARLEESGKSVTGYHSMKFTDGRAWRQYRGSAGFVLGTSLCYRRRWWEGHKFPDEQMGEDSAFVAMAVRERQLAAEGDLELMYATIHPGNTSPRPSEPHGNWIPLPGYEWKVAA